MVIRPGRAPIRSSGGAYRAAIAFLRSLGTSAHAWIPGASGVSVATLPSNNYLLSDGSTGYSTVDGVDGLTLDGMGSLGSELNTSLNFTGWTPQADWAINSGVASYSGSGGTNVLVNLGLVAGKTYLLTVNATVSSGGFRLLCGFDTASSTFTTSGQQSSILIRGTNAFVYVAAVGASVLSFSSISVKEYTGTHLTQPTTANKPLVRRGMFNQVINSNNVAAWSTTAAGTVTNGQPDPLGGTNAQLFFGANKNCYMAGPYAGSVAAGTPVTHAIYCYSAIAGTITIGNGNGSPQSLISISAGWGVYVFSWTAAANDGPAVVLNGTLTSVTIYNQGFFKGTWTAAQILAEGGIPTTTATAASNPSAGKYWWSFDGSNGSMLSGNLGITTACTIVISLRVNSLAATQIIFAEDTNGAQVSIATNGAVSLTKVGGAALVTTAAGVVVAGVPLVLTVRLSAGTADIRKNGAQSATAASALTFSAVTGARVGTAFNGTSNPTGGAFGWVVPSAVGLSDADCLTVERLVGSQFPGMAVF